jgi:UDP-N-acetylmuramoylalanine--D-glutamate ligase
MSRPRVLVYGLAIAGEAVARALVTRGYKVIAADDKPSARAIEVASELGIDLYEAPSESKIDRLVERVELVVPAPGVPETHHLMAACAREHVLLRSEIDLAYEWEQDRPGGPRPMLAITGTDGKTTTTMLATAMVEASGRRAAAVGNTDFPLIGALGDVDGRGPVDVFVVECTSFRLAYAEQFAPAAATWLNLAEDHLDWHRSSTSYADAKARIWEHQRPTDAAIGFAADASVMGYLANAPARHLTFGTAAADYRAEDGWLVGPGGPIAEIATMRRQLPHDITNALAAAATVLESGCATIEGVAAAVASFAGVRHRITEVAMRDGVTYYDDSKATTPHAALTAMRAFASVVLIAGGRNKGLDLGALAQGADHVRAVVAIGDSAAEVADAFAGLRPTVTATSMQDAVEQASALARPGDAVLLSPGCASFDWYKNYGARGDDFARIVAELVGGAR